MTLVYRGLVFLQRRLLVVRGGLVIRCIKEWLGGLAQMIKHYFEIIKLKKRCCLVVKRLSVVSGFRFVVSGFLVLN